MVYNACKEEKRETGYNRDKPPNDDCCPICFGDFNVACKADCGHWFCGSCILQLWEYRSRPQRCKCPFCYSAISKLTPEADAVYETEYEVFDVLANILQYNRFYITGIESFLLMLDYYLQKHGLFWHRYAWNLLRAFVLLVITSPALLKRVFVDLISHPERVSLNFQRVRMTACILSLLSHLYHSFLQPGHLRLRMTKIRLYINCASIILFVLPYTLVMCKTWIHIMCLRFRIWLVRREVLALRAHNAALREQVAALREQANVLRRQEVGFGENVVLLEQNDAAPKLASGVARQQQYEPPLRETEASSQ